MNARMVFPCYNEPDLKASFNLSLIYSSFYNAVHNMETVEDRCIGYKNQEEKICRNFSSQSSMAPYQLAFSTITMKRTKHTQTNKVEDYTNDRFEELTTAVNHTMTLLEDFHDLLGVQYPF